MCGFREYVSNLCVFYGILLNYFGNLQILPMGNVHHFRRIRKNDVMFLKMCVFSLKFSELFGKSTNSTHGKRASFSQNSQTWRPFSEN